MNIYLIYILVPVIVVCAFVQVKVYKSFSVSVLVCFGDLKNLTFIVYCFIPRISLCAAHIHQKRKPKRNLPPLFVKFTTSHTVYNTHYFPFKYNAKPLSLGRSMRIDVLLLDERIGNAECGLFLCANSRIIR